MKLSLHCITGLKPLLSFIWNCRCTVLQGWNRYWVSYETVAALYYRAETVTEFHMKLSLHCITGLKPLLSFIWNCRCTVLQGWNRYWVSYETVAALYYRAETVTEFHMKLSLHCITGLKPLLSFIWNCRCTVLQGWNRYWVSYETVAALYYRAETVTEFHMKLSLHCITGLKPLLSFIWNCRCTVLQGWNRYWVSYETVAALYYRAETVTEFHMKLSLHCITGLKPLLSFIWNPVLCITGLKQLLFNGIARFRERVRLNSFKLKS